MSVIGYEVKKKLLFRYINGENNEILISVKKITPEKNFTKYRNQILFSTVLEG